MPVPLLLLAALAATQPAASASRGRVFISPMGEPFRGSADGLAAWFGQADQNHDGSLTLDEMRKDAERFYATLDANHDGEIDPDEIDHYENVIAPEVRSGSGSFASQNLNDEATGGGRLGLLTIPEPVVAADTNLNRGVSLQEFDTAAEKRFGLLDRNGDGRLVLPQLEAMRSAVRANARHPRKSETVQPSDAGGQSTGDDSQPPM